MEANSSVKSLITAHCLNGHWSARFNDEPHYGVGGDTPTTALERLLEKATHRVPKKYTLSVADEHCVGETLAWYLEEEVCPDCNGTGWYVGLNVKEKCSSCG